MNALFSRLLFKTSPRAAKRSPDGTVFFEFDPAAGMDGNLLLTPPNGVSRPFGGNARSGTPVAGVKAVKTLTSNNTNVNDSSAATGTLTFTANPTAGDTVTIGAKAYTFRAAVTTIANEVKIGVSASASLDNLIAAVNGAAGSGTTYGSLTSASTQVIAAAGAGDTLTLTAVTKGTAGNAIVTTETFTGAGNLFGAATLTGAVNATTVTIGTKTYTFRTALTPLEGEVLIGADADASLLNLIRAINHTDTADTDYKCYAQHPHFAAAASVTAHAFAITARSAGLAATSLATTENSATLSWANTTAGVDGTPASAGDMMFDGTLFYFANADLTTASLTGWRKISHAAL